MECTYHAYPVNTGKYFLLYLMINFLYFYINQLYKENLMGVITDILKELPLSAVLKEQIIGLEKKMSDLEAENLIFKTKLQESEVQINQYVEKVATLEKLLQNTSYTMQWGCLVFPNDKRLYCPKCYFDKSRKIPTSRKSSKFRYCSVCQADIPSR